MAARDRDDDKKKKMKLYVGIGIGVLALGAGIIYAMSGDKPDYSYQQGKLQTFENENP